MWFTRTVSVFTSTAKSSYARSLSFFFLFLSLFTCNRENPIVDRNKSVLAYWIVSKDRIWWSAKLIIWKKLKHTSYVETEKFFCMFTVFCHTPTYNETWTDSIPKPGKDPKLIENRRPITLRNFDYKLLTYIFTARLQLGISNLIAETQSRFLNGRSIHNNIRLVMDIIEYRNHIEQDGFLLLLSHQPTSWWYNIISTR